MRECAMCALKEPISLIEPITKYVKRALAKSNKWTINKFITRPLPSRNKKIK